MSILDVWLTLLIQANLFGPCHCHLLMLFLVLSGGIGQPMGNDLYTELPTKISNLKYVNSSHNDLRWIYKKIMPMESSIKDGIWSLILPDCTLYDDTLRCDCNLATKISAFFYQLEKSLRSITKT